MLELWPGTSSTSRPPSLRVASRWPLRDWAKGVVELDEAFAAEMGAWQLQGVRPANHPRARLKQYAAWTQARPDWPAQLATLSKALPEILPTIAARSTTGAWLRGAAEEICVARR